MQEHSGRCWRTYKRDIGSCLSDGSDQGSDEEPDAIPHDGSDQGSDERVRANATPPPRANATPTPPISVSECHGTDEGSDAKPPPTRPPPTNAGSYEGADMPNRIH